MEMAVLLFIQDHLRNFLLTPVFRIITFSGNNGMIWIAISVLLLFNRKTRFIGIISLVALLEVVLINNMLIKSSVARLRPFINHEEIKLLIPAPSGYSFASGHSCAAFASGVVFLKYLKRKLGIIIIIYAGLVAFSRLYFGVHYPSDVLAGITLGTVFALSSSYVYERFFSKRTLFHLE